MDIANRMKNHYEKRSESLLTRRIPVVCRIDGKAFHSYTKNMKKPFDHDFIHDMYSAAASVMVALV